MEKPQYGLGGRSRGADHQDHPSGRQAPSGRGHRAGLEGFESAREPGDDGIRQRDADRVEEQGEAEGVRLPCLELAPRQRIQPTPGCICEVEDRGGPAEPTGVACRSVDRKDRIRLNRGAPGAGLQHAVAPDRGRSLLDVDPGDEPGGAVADQGKIQGVAPPQQQAHHHGVSLGVGVGDPHLDPPRGRAQGVRRQDHFRRQWTQHRKESHRRVAPIARHAEHGPDRVPPGSRLDGQVADHHLLGRPERGKARIGPHRWGRLGQGQGPLAGILGAIRPERDREVVAPVVLGVQPEGEGCVPFVGKVPGRIDGGPDLEGRGRLARIHQEGIARVERHFVGTVPHHHRPAGVDDGIPAVGREDPAQGEVVHARLQAHERIQAEPEATSLATSRQPDRALPVGEVLDPETVGPGPGHDGSQHFHHRLAEAVRIVGRDHHEIAMGLHGEVVEGLPVGLGIGIGGDHEPEHRHRGIGGQGPGLAHVGGRGVGKQDREGLDVVAGPPVGNQDDGLVLVGRRLAHRGGFPSLQQHPRPAKGPGIAGSPARAQVDGRLQIRVLERIVQLVEDGRTERRFEGQEGGVGSGRRVLVHLDRLAEDDPALGGRVRAVRSVHGSGVVQQIGDVGSGHHGGGRTAQDQPFGGQSGGVARHPQGVAVEVGEIHAPLGAGEGRGEQVAARTGLEGKRPRRGGISKTNSFRTVGSAAAWIRRVFSP